tara:strand:+ start:491 stop:754 length:264 start_codon:yes stop_codon:yes gene_type:complete
MGNAYLFTYNLETSKFYVNKLCFNSSPFNLNMKFNCYYSTELIEIFIINLNEILGIVVIFRAIRRITNRTKKSKNLILKVNLLNYIL